MTPRPRVRTGLVAAAMLAAALVGVGAPAAPAVPRVDGDVLITFDTFPLGTYVTTQYRGQGIDFGGAQPFITGDTAAPHTPVLSGTPTFRGTIEGRFVMPDGSPRTVDRFTVNVGWIDVPGTVQVAAFDAGGATVKTVVLQQEGYNPVPFELSGIAGFRVTASETSVDSAGFSIDDVSFPPPPTAFSSPTPSGVAADAGDGQATVTWQAVPAPGSGPVATAYAVQQSVDTGRTWTTATGSPTIATRLVVTGLANGTPIQFRVASVNSFGPGPYSAATAAVTPAAPVVVPGKVTGLTAVSRVRRTIAVSWGAPATGSAPTGYRYKVRRSTGPYGAWRSVGPTTRRVVISGLSSGVRYGIVVVAVNTAGNGPASAIAVTVR